MSRVLVAMSGGVDSSVAAALLVGQGHDVTGVHLKLSDVAYSDPDGRVHGCCSVEAADDARRVAQTLGIPFYVWNLADAFHETVVDDFVGEYAAGRTPNPCVRCNERVKFGLVLRRGVSLGYDYVATGHYAIASHGPDGKSRLYRGADDRKDQSYVLATIGQDALQRALFPVGAMTKSQTRDAARSLALRTADKPESYDICFVPDGDPAGFVASARSFEPGPILNETGETIGRHDGIHAFTVGQRRGLGLATHERRFVVDVDAQRNAIVVGAAELLMRTRIRASEPVWLHDAPEPGREVTVQIRAHGAHLPARIDPAAPGEVEVRLERPERGIAAGQLIAFYDGNEVLGGATIASSAR